MSTPATTSTEVATILCLLKHYDRAQSIFERYSTRRKGDRDFLSIGLQPKATLDCDLLGSLSRVFPFRVVGPFLFENSLEIDVVDTAILPDGDEHQRNPALFSLAPRKRRARDTLDAVRDSMLQLLVDPEHPATSVVEATRDGQDALGAWLEFDLVAATRIDLGVLLQCKVIPACECVKSMSIEMRTKPVLHVRLYGDDEHRIVTSWEVVCAMPRTGGFVALRRRVSFEAIGAE
tara:strand:+ start:4027 stop:4728 length:702 start_codon:yes stop_codon:yes gene_type:complete